MQRTALATPLWVLAFAAFAIVLSSPRALATPECVPVAAWVMPDGKGGERLANTAVIKTAAQRSVVLLGESHDSFEHHRWQLQTVIALHAHRPRMVLAFEMFPKRVQPALDRWVAGELDEVEFLKASDWRTVWNFDPGLYLPIFHFARMNRIPMVALNVERGLTRQVTMQGLDKVPADQREGVTRPAPASEPYVAMLHDAYLQHQPPDGGPKAKGKPTRSDPAFLRFVESQQVWDRAMAQRIADALARDPGVLVVGLMGSGHLVHGHGLPHQLRDLGVKDVAWFLPWDRDKACGMLVAGIADAVFGVAAPASNIRVRPRLGVLLEPGEAGIRVRQVETGSLAEAAGLREGDSIVEIAGVRAQQAADVSEVVQRQPAGTWLPMKVTRQGEPIDIVAKFPAAAPK